MANQASTFLSVLGDMKIEEVRASFYELFEEALAIEDEEAAQGYTRIQDDDEEE